MKINQTLSCSEEQKAIEDYASLPQLEKLPEHVRAEIAEEMFWSDWRERNRPW
jgi:hypothetical protein